MGKNEVRHFSLLVVTTLRPNNFNILFLNKLVLLESCQSGKSSPAEAPKKCNILTSWGQIMLGHASIDNIDVPKIDVGSEKITNFKLRASSERETCENLTPMFHHKLRNTCTDNSNARPLAQNQNK